MNTTCECTDIHICRSCFEEQISTLPGLLEAIRVDEESRFTLRDTPIPRLYSNPPRPRRRPLRGLTHRRLGQGYIDTWDLRDEAGNEIDICYVQGERLGIPNKIPDKQMMITDAYALPEDLDITYTIVVNIWPLHYFTQEEQTAIFAALRRLYRISS